MFQNASRVRFSTSRQSLGCSNRMFIVLFKIFAYDDGRLRIRRRSRGGGDALH